MSTATTSKTAPTDTNDCKDKMLHDWLDETVGDVLKTAWLDVASAALLVKLFDTAREKGLKVEVVALSTVVE